MSCRTVVSRPKHPPRPSFAIHAIWEPRPQGHTLWRKRFPAAYTQHFSSSSAIAAEKPLVLDKPDKFRPPSHPTRLNARRMPRYYPGPPIPEAEKQAQAKRKYPHTFPKQGTRMHWFLTNKYVHVWISLGTLFTLAFVSLTQSFLQTSPFAHLTPSISTLPTAPISFFREWFSVIRLHQEYKSQQTAESRKRGIADAQKRRLYRRAHGMEDLDKEGIDVRGLVPWDDGLTNAERERMRSAAQEAGREAVDGQSDAGPVNQRDFGEEEQVMPVEPRRERRPLKKWLGIW